MSTSIPPNLRRLFEILGVLVSFVAGALATAVFFGTLSTEVAQTRDDIDDQGRDLAAINERVRRLEIDAASDTERLKQLSESISRQSEALERIEQRLEQIHPQMRRR